MPARTTVEQSEAEVREDLAAAFRLADHYGFSEAIDNHFSAKVAGGNGRRFLINRWGLHWSEHTPDSMVLCDLDNDPPGGPVGADGRPMVESTAYTIHGHIHAARADAHVLLHTHMPYATALACLEDPTLLMLNQTSCRFHGRTAYDPVFGGIATAEQEGARLAEATADKDIVFLANHGVITIGPNVPQAFADLYYLERHCHLQVLAMSANAPIRILPDDVIRLTAGQWNMSRDMDEEDRAFFEAAKRRFVRRTPAPAFPAAAA